MAENRWRIAITGIGLVTPLGLTAVETTSRILRGETAAVLRAESETDPTGGAAFAAVPEFDVSKVLRNPKNLKLMSRPVRMALIATREAVDRSRLGESGIASERTGVYIGSGQTGMEYDEFFKALTIAWEGGREQDFKHLGAMPTRTLDRYFSLRTLANAGVGAISTEFGARGPSNNYVQGETASAVAIYNACLDLMEDRCDAAIVCGYESLRVPSMVAAFRKMGMLSGGGFGVCYTPFNAGRPGMILGEGAGCLVLERNDSASARGVEILGEIDGVGLASQTTDVDGLTAGPDDLRAAAEDAMESAGDPIAPDFVIARGLGTEEDDLAEANGLSSFLASGTAVSAFKGHTGYLGAATAAIEIGIGVLCARQGLAPAIFGLSHPDERMHLNFIQGEPAAIGPLGLYFSSTFGGQVAAIAARAVSHG